MRGFLLPAAMPLLVITAGAVDHDGARVVHCQSMTPPTHSSLSRMAKIIAVTLGVSGHLFPFVPILQALQHRGHSVSLALADTELRTRAFAGLPVVHVQLPLARTTTVSPAARYLAWQQDIQTFRLYGEPLTLELERVVAEQRPDVLLLDPKLWGAIVAADALGIRWAAVAHNPLMFRATGLDVRGPGMPPPTNWLRRFQHHAIQHLIVREFADYLAEVNRVRRTRGQLAIASLDDLCTLAPLTLATTAPPFEYSRSDWSPTLHFIGPMIWSPTPSRQLELPSGDRRPLILVAGSSVPAKPGQALWATRVVNALIGSDFRLAATLPTEPVPQAGWPDVSLFQSFSHDAILPEAACVVCHGGPGITQRALWYGVPVVAVPFAYDRFEVARRLEACRAGVMLPLNDLSPTRVRAAVRDAITRKAGAEEVGRHFRAAGGADRAVTLIEVALLGGIGESRHASLGVQASTRY